MYSIIDKLISNYEELATVKYQILQAFELLKDTYEAGGKLLLCGNGGSAADCEHIVGELLKEFKIRRPITDNLKNQLLTAGQDDTFCRSLYGALPAISLVSHVGFITAFHNDADSDFVYAQQLNALGKEPDTLWGITTSGNSRNVINAAIVARAKHMKVIGMTGQTGGSMKDYCDVCICAPSEETARIQEYHLPIYHCICEMLEEYFFGNEGNKNETQL